MQWKGKNMELIWLLIVITCLSKHLHADYRKTNTSGAWTDMHNECTLATPTILYSGNELTVEINQDIELAKDEEIWVGYTEDFEIFRFHGCIHQHNVESKSTLDMISTLGLCYSACSTARFFGVRMNSTNKVTCHCIESFKRTDLASCGNKGNNRFAFGKSGYLALYERVSIGLNNTLKKLPSWENMTNSCLHFLNPESETVKVQWSSCSIYYSPLCANSSGFKFQYTGNYSSWKKAADICLDMQQYPVQYQSGEGFNSSNQFWLANIRSRTITKDEGQRTSKFKKYGYIVKENSKLTLRFKEQRRNLQGLCFEDTAVDDSSNGLVGVYVGVTVVIVLVVIVVGAVIVFKRKRRASPEKINNTRRNLTYESNAQPNQNLNANRPDSAEVHHEIQDVTELTNEGYDTIPDGYLQKSTQYNNTSVAYFVLEKHNNVDYEIAKEVIGEPEHVYDRKSKNTAMVITHDYDHTSNGNTALKQSPSDQPYDTTGSVKQKYQDPTYDHTGDHTSYNHTGNNADYDHTGDHTSYNHTGNNADYDHTGDHTFYNHTGNNADYDHTGDHTSYNHTGNNADYDHTGDHTTNNHTWKQKSYSHNGDHATYDRSGENADYNHNGDNADYDHTGDHSPYDHTGDHNSYDHIGDNAN